MDFREQIKQQEKMDEEMKREAFKKMCDDNEVK